ncbi:hypothetical protein COO91_09167 (plasmid) [Nostoc flagelliforme CCNUN1]|uniref:Uncharacterized protein n=1 Tax=Nostoc flagelliforme CCNUN1 TaxID=2038116 RepID=A0A2K8T5S2_9NOSO|nr:hypothetical protein COO91_09167 [Nostoc flagelliforme CCNUN1]
MLMDTTNWMRGIYPFGQSASALLLLIENAATALKFLQQSSSSKAL